MVHLIALGLVSILGQVILLRELHAAFFGVDLIYALALGVWLFWTAAGALTCWRRVTPKKARIRGFFAVFGVVLLLDVAFLRTFRPLFSLTPGAYMAFPMQLFLMAASLLPIGWLSGWIFQSAAKLYLDQGKTMARAYAWESLGGLCGGILATLLLALEVQNFVQAWLCSIVAICIAAFHKSKIRARYLPSRLSLLLVPVLLLTLQLSVILDRRLTKCANPYLLESRDSPYGRITITSAEDEIAVLEDNALSYTTQGTEAEEFVHFAVLQHVDPKRVLVLGGAMEGIVQEVLIHSPQRIDHVELNPVLAEMAESYMKLEQKASLQVPAVHRTIADPRQFLSQGEDTYDLILVAMPEPASSQANRFYTREFFELCRRRLDRDGLLAFRLKSAENFWTPPLIQRTASIQRALQAVFTDVLILPGATNLVMASSAVLSRNPAISVQRFHERKITARLVSPRYIHYLYTNDRVHQMATTLAGQRVDANTDERPVCYQYTMILWLSKFFPGLAASHERPAVGEIAWGVGIAGFVLCFAAVVLCRRYQRFAGIVLMVLAAFAGMVLEILLILLYQVKYGILYQNIGLLLMAFMGGLGLGASVIEYYAAKKGIEKLPMLWWEGGPISAFILLCCWTAWRVNSASAIGLVETMLLLLVTGCLVSAVFALLGFQQTQDAKQMLPWLYAADLLGGGLGSLAGTLLLIPQVGLVMTALVLIPLLALSLLLLPLFARKSMLGFES